MTRKVLVVDDEKHLVKIITFNLRQKGYETESACNGKECLEKVESFRPDLIILDVMMPIMSGYEVCEKMKGSDETRAIPIILLTAKGQELDRDKGEKFGADEYMTKPFSPRLLMSTVARLLGEGAEGS